jgi:hypothetical protein
VDLPLETLLALGVVGALAGFVDAIAGGGGLLTVPALMMTGLPPSLVLGTNKGQSVFGSGSALWRFGRSALLNRERAKVQVIPALVGAAVGVQLVSLLSNAVLRPVVMVLLTSVALFLLVRRAPAESGPPISRPTWVAMAVAGALGLYDGFFGPGTGTFLIMAYVTLWQDPMDQASANAKVVNFCSNLASMAAFAWAGMIVWKVALCMAVGQAVGGQLGAHLTISHGQGLVRRVVIGISLCLVGRMAYQLYGG